MNNLVIEIDAISQMALKTMQAIMARDAEAQKIMGDDTGPRTLASALSDFFQTAATLEPDECYMDPDDMSEFGAYGLDLLDRLDFLVRKLEIMDQKENLSRVVPSLAVWLARHDAIIDNLQGTADGFAMLVNGLSTPQDLADMCQIMEEVIAAASEELQMDEDRSNEWRPWRIINLNSGIAATRSLDPELMESTFEKLGRRLPYDMPGFVADGKRQMLAQDVPEAVSAVMNRYAEKWSSKPPH
ncbi:MAG: hypothetical protein U9N50_14585 [Pseudomonadota bacterium]|nr:hypothetical protein [Pseudomonadota bacterium]